MPTFEVLLIWSNNAQSTLVFSAPSLIDLLSDTRLDDFIFREKALIEGHRMSHVTLHRIEIEEQL